MSSVIRYDLINYFLKEPVKISILNPIYPMQNTLILAPRQNANSESIQDGEPVSALIESTRNRRKGNSREIRGVDGVGLLVTFTSRTA
jgi:hypothetical protein